MVSMVSMVSMEQETTSRQKKKQRPMVYTRCINTNQDAIPSLMRILCEWPLWFLFLEGRYRTVPKYSMVHPTSGYRNDPRVLGARVWILKILGKDTAESWMLPPVPC